MATFSTNQVKQLYVVKAIDADLDTLGDAKFGTTQDGDVFLQYKGRDGVTRSDLIKKENITYAKATAAEKMAYKLENTKISVNGGTVVAGQQYILKVTINEFAGMTYEDKGFIFADYTAKAGDAAKNVLANLAVTLAKNASKAAYNELIKVTLFAESADTKVTATTKLAALTGEYDALVIEAVEQPWTLGKERVAKLYFDVAADSVIVSGIETSWANIVKNGATPTTIVNSKQIADLEYFCAGERGDMYRGIGWPNNFEFKPLVNAESADGYDVLDINYFYAGDAEDVQRSTKELVIVCPAASPKVINDVIRAFNSAAGTNVSTL